MAQVDPGLFRLAAELVRPGAVVWDVGANVGLFSFAAAHLAGARGSVAAFEADSWLVGLLRRSAAIQPPSSAPVQVVPAAVAGSCGLRSFNISSRSRSSSFLSGYGSSQAGAVAERQTVVALSLDWVAERLPPPDVLKIDVEGAELEVLEGATRLLEARRPVLLCEVSAPRSAEVAALLRGRGYRVLDGDEAPARRGDLAAAPWTTLALPVRP
jgi:FkbM family methyltransferase